MKNDVILNKKETIEKCIRRVETVYENKPEHLKDFTKQDSIVLNLQRACEDSIDLAMHLVSEQTLGLPKTSREAFDMLAREGMIDTTLATSLKNRLGFC